MRFLSSIASCHRSSLKRDVNCSAFPCHFLLYKFAQNDVKNRMFRCYVRTVRLLAPRLLRLSVHPYSGHTYVTYYIKNLRNMIISSWLGGWVEVFLKIILI